MVLAVGCASTSAPEITSEQIKELDAIVNSKSFEFKARWARPLVTSSLNSVANAGLLPQGSTINNIDLVGNNNYLRMNGDSVVAYFPYFGERQLGGTAYLGSNNAIEFEGVPGNMKINKNEKGYMVAFDIKHKTETFQVNAQLFPNKKSNININSTHRFPISYIGNFEKTEEQLH
ncbi:uncharacterized protein DUF4251 [Flagellimonas meridianipacifica]|uniref:Uncharacterized protein DUF4251 n=2 Tax=Flagellimonas meridianipacifica TaxID=1080225 RepID=A0A2T0MBF5_9FLAO|nr:uncharacterized protein DUF4251 [Allomuricauda pacifica]